MIFYPRMHKGNGHVYHVFEERPVRGMDGSSLKKQAEQLQLDIQSSNGCSIIFSTLAVLSGAGYFALPYFKNSELLKYGKAESLVTSLLVIAVVSVAAPFLDAYLLNKRDKELARKIALLDGDSQKGVRQYVKSWTAKDKKILSYTRAGRALLNL